MGVSQSPNEPAARSPRSIDHLNLPRALLITAGFAIAAFFFLNNGTTTQTTGGGPTTTAAPASTTTKPSTTTTVPRSQIKVQVANASTVAGAATKITQQLQTLGWNTLPPVNATAQSPASKVYYAQGRQAAATEIASELKLPASSVAPLTTSVPVPGAAGDDVVVLVGPELAS